MYAHPSRISFAIAIGNGIRARWSPVLPRKAEFSREKRDNSRSDFVPTPPPRRPSFLPRAGISSGARASSYLLSHRRRGPRRSLLHRVVVKFVTRARARALYSFTEHPRESRDRSALVVRRHFEARSRLEWRGFRRAPSGGHVTARTAPLGWVRDYSAPPPSLPWLRRHVHGGPRGSARKVARARAGASADPREIRRKSPRISSFAFSPRLMNDFVREIKLKRSPA